jgi:hypothetical protein
MVFVQNATCIFLEMWYTIIVPRERAKPPREKKKKTLDKSPNLWYNKYIKGS